MSLKLFCPFLFIFLISLLSHEVQSQSQLKWGKLSKSEIDLKECAYEPEAEAVILSTAGEVEFNYGDQVFIRKHIRIKILKEAGLKYADIIIPYYNHNETESINSLRAQTLNIDEKGNVVAQKVESSQIFDVQKNEFWKEKRFIFPSIKAGSIIEYSYVTVSKNVVFLKGWTFQDEIPTLHSEMKARITEGLDYRILYQGNRLIKKYQKPDGNSWSLDDLPSIKEEPFTTNHFNYAESIRFQLAGYNTKKAYNQGYEYVNLMTTWEKLAQEILSEESYKAILNRSGKAREILNSIKFSEENDLKKAEKIYEYVKDNLVWNGSYRRNPDHNLAAVFQQKQATSAEINLALTALLKEAGFQAHPALISTRSHGNVVKVYPLLSQFNHVITWVSIGKNEFLLDATDPLRPFNLLDEEDLNENALVLDPANTRWIEVKPAGITKSTLMATVDLSNLTAPTVSLESRLEGYTAYNQRKKWKEGMDPHLLLNQLKVTVPFQNLENIEIANPKDIMLPFSCKTTFSVPELVDVNNNLVYLKPLLTEKNNPFKSLSRSYPVDFGYPSSEYSTIHIKIPDNYIVEELPEGLHLKLPRDYGYFLYQIDYKGKDLQLVIRHNIQKTVIPAQDYAALREFYDLIIAKTNEMIVLKKL